MHDKHHHARYLLSGCLLVLLGSTPLPGQSSASFERALQAETDPRKVADLIWSTVLMRCGDSAFKLTESYQAILTEYKKPTFELKIDKLSPSDRLNGMEWSGRAVLHTIASRTIYAVYGDSKERPLCCLALPPLLWSSWETPQYPEAGEASYTFWRKNHTWTVDSLYLPERKFSCAEAIAKEPFAKYKVRNPAEAR